MAASIFRDIFRSLQQFFSHEYPKPIHVSITRVVQIFAEILSWRAFAGNDCSDHPICVRFLTTHFPISVLELSRCPCSPSISNFCLLFYLRIKITPPQQKYSKSQTWFHFSRLFQSLQIFAAVTSPPLRRHDLAAAPLLFNHPRRGGDAPPRQRECSPMRRSHRRTAVRRFIRA